MADFYEEILTGLQSKNPDEQTDAAMRLQRIDGPLSPAAWSQLANTFRNCDLAAFTAPVMRQLIKGMFVQTAAGFAAQSEPRYEISSKPPAAVHIPGSLVNWLFEPLFRKSLMLSVMSGNGLTRDESAVGFMNRLLSWNDFPETTFYKCRILSQDWRNYLWKSEYQAVGFFGRLPLYGPDVVADYDNPSLRFLPSNAPRPKRLRHRQIDKDYHCVHEVVAGRPRCTFRTHFKERSPRMRDRVDYAIVQRYVVRPGGNRIVVFRIWGPSSLGTEGAALWASADLPKLFGSDRNEPVMLTGKHGIPLKADGSPAYDADSSFEALLEVEAEETRASWGPISVNLKRLYLDNFAWDKATCTWSNATPREIRIRYDGTRASEVIFDGNENDVKRPDSEILRVLIAAIECAVENPRREFSLQALIDRADIWVGGQGSEDKARGHVYQLKFRYVHTMENRNNQQPRFLCDLVLERNGKVEIYPAPDLPAEPLSPTNIQTLTKVARPRKSK